MQTINNRVLVHISSEILNGRPLWGLVWVNRYFAPNDKLRAAFIKKAKAQMTESRYFEMRDVIDALEVGFTFEALSEKLQAKLKGFSETRSDRSYAYKFNVPARTSRFGEIRKVRAVSGRR